MRYAASYGDCIPPEEQDGRADALAEAVEVELDEMMGETDCVHDWLDHVDYPDAVYGLLADLMGCGLPGLETDEPSDAYRDKLDNAIQSLRDDYRAWANRDPCNCGNSRAAQRVLNRWEDHP